MQKTNSIYRALILFVCLLTGGLVRAQFPVQVVPQLLPPYSLQLSDYYSGTIDKLIVLLTDRDLTRPSLSVHLQLSISGQSATINSKPTAYYPAITIDAGMPVRISGSELAPYFNPDNLDFQGITKAQYLQSGKLPEGFYQFCIQAIETTTGRVVSQSSCAMAWLSLSDPPLLNTPATSTNVAFRDPLNLLFSWTPRNMSSPNSAFSTAYTFQLIEITDTAIDPSAAFQMYPVLYETTVNTTTFLYGPGMPSLLNGKRYAWRVQAHANSNGQELDLYRNSGYSQVNWFLLQDNCLPPQQTTATIQGGGVHISWIPQSQMLGYEVDYRVKGQDDAAWFTQMSTDDSVVLYDIKAGQSYEYRIGGSCSVSGGTTYGDIQGFTVPAQDSIGNPNCGILPNINITNQAPLPSMSAGDVFKAGDFPVKVLQTAGQGSYTGNGYVTVPFLGQAMVKVNFSHIGINTDHQLISGVVVTAFDSTAAGITDISQPAPTVNGLIDSMGNTSKNAVVTSDDIDSLKQMTKTLSQGIDSLIASGAIKASDSAAVKDLVSQLSGEVQSLADSTGSTKDQAAIASTLSKIQDMVDNDESSGSDDANAGNKTYFTIGSKTFYTGDVVYLPKSAKAYTVKAFHANGKSFRNGSIWSGVNSVVDSTTARLVASVTSASVPGNDIRIVDTTTGRSDSITVNVVTVDFAFRESATQLYGFDENDPATENDYPSYQTTPVPGIKWKSLNSDGTPDNLWVDITPAAAAGHVYFTLSDSVNFSVTPKVPTSGSQLLAVTSTSNNTNTSIIPKVGWFKNDTMQIKAVGRTKKINRARVILVNESNDDIQSVPLNAATPSDTTVVILSGPNHFLDSRKGIDILGDDRVVYRPWAGDTVVVAGPNKICESTAYNTDVLTTAISASQLKDTLNKYYSQAVYEWDVDTVIIRKTINFDFNRDGKVDVNSWSNRETQAIYAQCIPDNSKVNFIAVNNPSDGSSGMSEFPASNPNKVCFLHPNRAPNVYMTGCHEIGHGLFSLQHPFDQFPAFPKGGKDLLNIMNYGLIRIKFRKYQWDQIR